MLLKSFLIKYSDVKVDESFIIFVSYKGFKVIPVQPSFSLVFC